MPNSRDDSILRKHNKSSSSFALPCLIFLLNLLPLHKRLVLNHHPNMSRDWSSLWPIAGLFHDFPVSFGSEVKLIFGSPHYKVMVRLSFANIQLYNENYLYLVRRQTDYFLNEIFECLPCYLKKTFVYV